MSTPEQRLTDLEQQVLALWRTIHGEQKSDPLQASPPATEGLEPVPVFNRERARVPVVSERTIEDFRRVADQIALEIEARVYE